MITPDKEREVIVLLARGCYSLRKIAQITGVSWGTVKSIRDDGPRKASEGSVRDDRMRIDIYADMASHAASDPNIIAAIPQMLCIMDDVQALSRMKSDDPLLKSLATRSRDVFDRILKHRSN